MKKIIVLILLSIAVCLVAQTPDVVINEFMPKGSEWVELYNTTGSSIDLTGWFVHSVEDGDSFTLSGTINANDYAVFQLSYLMDNDGDSLFLKNSSSTIIDFVYFGNLGPAPLAPSYFSCSRITDGYYTGDLANDFNLDGSPTEGTVNDVAAAPLNAPVAVNEIDPYPDGGGCDSVELYNTTSSTIDITGWYICDGDDFAVIGVHQIPAYGFLVIDEDETGIDFASRDVAYLFMPDTQRVDQLGWYPDYNDFTYQRVPDGSTPHNGFDWASCGGGTVLFDTTETWGYSNGGSFVAENPVIINPNTYSLFCTPFSNNGNIMISFSALKEVKINIYNINGSLVKSLYQGTGERTIYWNTSDNNGEKVSLGTYLVVMETQDNLISRKINLIIQ